MEPHRRKDMPPRREHGEEPEGSPEPSTEAYEQGEAAYPAEEIPYDPGAAFVDDNQYYGETGEAGYDPNAAYDSQAHYDPSQYETETAPADYQTPEADGYPAPSGMGGVYDEAPQPPAPRPSRSAPAKKVSRRGATRRPATGGRTAAGVRRPLPKPVYGGGISVMTVFLGVIALGMLAGVVMAVLPKDMSAVKGYPVSPLDGSKPRNLLAEMQKLMIDRKAELPLTEEEVNLYLNHRLSGEQKGAMAMIVKFRGVFVDFSANKAEVVIERELFGMPMTMSVELVTEDVRRQVYFKPAVWHIGRIPLGERTVKPVVDLFIRLRGSVVDEYYSLQQMTGVRFEQDRVVLDARI